MKRLFHNGQPTRDGVRKIYEGMISNSPSISFDSTFRYILVDDVLSLNNSKFGDYVECIYPIELEIKNTTDTVGFIS